MPFDDHVAVFLAAAAEANDGRPATHEGTVQQARDGYDAMAGLGPGPELHSVVDTASPGPEGQIGLRIYRPSGAEDLACLVFFHGGGWTIGSLLSHDRECREIASRADVAVVAVDYRLAPEHPYPAAVDDCWAALRYIADSGSELGIDTSRLAVGGDSAGGNLAAVMAIRARDAGIKLLLQLLVYPAVDFRQNYPSLQENADAPILPLSTMLWFCDHYFTDIAAERRLEPDASPLLAETLAGVAPALIATAEFDTLRDEGMAYAEALSDAGVTVEAEIWAGMPHAFMQLGPVVPAGGRLLDKMAAALREALAA